MADLKEHSACHKTNILNNQGSEEQKQIPIKEE
jgi:hypothetical protein